MLTHARIVRSRWFACFLCLAAAGLVLAGCAPATTTQPTEPVPTVVVATEALPTQPPAASPTAAPAATEVQEAITLTDFLGRAVTLDAPAERIVSLAPSNTEILFALGVGDRLVGRDDFSDFPPEALEVPSIGSLYPNVNAEEIVNLDPDLVLAAGITNPDDVNQLAELGLTVYSTSIATGLEDIYNDIRAVGVLTGREEAAEAVVADMEARVAAVTEKVAAVSERPTVFYEIDATEPAKPWTAGPNTFHDQLIQLAGGENLGNIASEQYVQLSLEQIVAEDPDVIVLGSATFGGQTPELVAQRPGWDTLTAVQNGAVYTFDDNLISRPGPRVVEGLEELARLIHPELFE